MNAKKKTETIITVQMTQEEVDEFLFVIGNHSRDSLVRMGEAGYAADGVDNSVWTLYYALIPHGTGE